MLIPGRSPALSPCRMADTGRFAEETRCSSYGLISAKSIGLTTVTTVSLLGDEVPIIIRTSGCLE